MKNRIGWFAAVVVLALSTAAAAPVASQAYLSDQECHTTVINASYPDYINNVAGPWGLTYIGNTFGFGGWPARMALNTVECGAAHQGRGGNGHVIYCGYRAIVSKPNGYPQVIWWTRFRECGSY